MLRQSPPTSSTRARTELERINEVALPVNVLYPTVLETYSVILRRVTPPVAHGWVQGLLERVSLINPTAEDYQDAVRVVARYADQTLSLFKGLLAVLAERFSVPIWTFDSDFEIMRVPVWRGEA